MDQGQIITPAPTSAETWVAVLVTVARQLTAAGHGTAADCVYQAVATFAAPTD